MYFRDPIYYNILHHRIMRPGVQEAEQRADRGGIRQVRRERGREAEQGGVPAVDGCQEMIDFHVYSSKLL